MNTIKTSLVHIWPKNTNFYLPLSIAFQIQFDAVLYLKKFVLLILPSHRKGTGNPLKFTFGRTFIFITASLIYSLIVPIFKFTIPPFAYL